MTQTQPHQSTTTPQQPAVVVPDKAALEGLEQKWSERWKADATYRFDRSQPTLAFAVVVAAQPEQPGQAELVICD